MSAEHDPDTYYQIVTKGRLGKRWADWFEGIEITHNEQGDTILTGPVADQSELQGILPAIGILNMTLISVTQIDVNSVTEPQTNQDTDALSD